MNCSAFYADVIRTPADRVPAGSPVIQAYEITGMAQDPHLRQSRAGAQLAKMCGWNEPDKVEMSADSLTSYLRELRSRSHGDYGQPVEGFTVADERQRRSLSSVQTICSGRWRSKMSVPAELTPREGDRVPRTDHYWV